MIPSTGGVPVQLTTDMGFDYGPIWSSDGDRIAFFSDRSGNRDIWSISATGGDATRITSDTFDELYPAWSPDGAAIAFASWNPGPGTNLWVKYLR
jgi:tricorn protease